MDMLPGRYTRRNVVPGISIACRRQQAEHTACEQANIKGFTVTLHLLSLSCVENSMHQRETFYPAGDIHNRDALWHPDYCRCRNLRATRIIRFLAYRAIR